MHMNISLVDRYTANLNRGCTHLVTPDNSPTGSTSSPLHPGQKDDETTPRQRRLQHQHADPSVKLALAVHNRAKWQTHIVGLDWVSECARRRMRLIEAHFAPPMCSKAAADAVTAEEMSRARRAAGLSPVPDASCRALEGHHCQDLTAPTAEAASAALPRSTAAPAASAPRELPSLLQSAAGRAPQDIKEHNASHGGGKRSRAAEQQSEQPGKLPIGPVRSTAMNAKPCLESNPTGHQKPALDSREKRASRPALAPLQTNAERQVQPSPSSKPPVKPAATMNENITAAGPAAAFTGVTAAVRPAMMSEGASLRRLAPPPQLSTSPVLPSAKRHRTGLSADRHHGGRDQQSFSCIAQASAAEARSSCCALEPPSVLVTRSVQLPSAAQRAGEQQLRASAPCLGRTVLADPEGGGTTLTSGACQLRFRCCYSRPLNMSQAHRELKLSCYGLYCPCQQNFGPCDIDQLTI